MCLTDLRQKREKYSLIAGYILYFTKTVLMVLSSFFFFVSRHPHVMGCQGFRLRTPCACPSRCGTTWPDSWCSEVWDEDSTPALWTGTHSPSSQISSSLGSTGVWVWSPASVHPCIWSLVLFWCTCTCRLLHSGSTKPPLTKVALLCTDACLQK